MSVLTVSDRLILVDGYGFVFRAYHSLPPLTRKDGVAVGAVYGFCSMLLKLLGDYPAEAMAVILDGGGKNFRHALYPSYKANRPPAPEDLIPQFPLVREASEHFDLPTISLPGVEADDIIATYTRLGREAGRQVLIVSSDKDLMQLVGEGVSMFDPLKSRTIGEAEVIEKFGVPPSLVGDVLALMGDSSDNVPGVPGIGPKTAAELLQTYGSLDSVLARAAEISQTKRRETLLAHQEIARLSRQLVALDSQVDVPMKVSEFQVVIPSSERLNGFFSAQNFSSLTSRAEKLWGKFSSLASDSPPLVSSVSRTIEVEHVADDAALAAWLSQRGDLRVVSLMFEEEAGAKDYAPKGVAVSVEGECVAYLSFLRGVEANAQSDLFASVQPEFEVSPLLLPESVRRLLADPSIVLLLFNSKKFFRYFIALKDQVHARVEDVQLLSYLLHGSAHSHDLHSLAARYDSDAPLVSGDLASVRGALLLCRLYPRFRESLREHQLTSLYERMERPLSLILARMEQRGVRVDSAILLGLSREWAERLRALETHIYQEAGHPFNVGSPKQLGDVLFAQMGLQGGKKSSKSGQYATGVDVLEELAAEGHLIARHVLDWRHFSKLKTTYADSLPKQIERDGRVHTHFAMTVTNTGRLSSSDPNLQNIPIRSEEGAQIRAAFVAEKGSVLIAADYSQIELRLLAHMADILPLKEAFRQGHDIHAKTASDIFSVPLDQVDASLRRSAKAINFGIIYGMSAFGLAQRLGIGRAEATDIIERYFRQYPGIERYVKETIAFAREHGFVRTLLGRKCFMPGIHDKNPGVRQFSERAAINAPLQGTAADVIKKAMVRLVEELEVIGLTDAMVLQVHDELVLEVPEAHCDVVVSLLRQVMESVVPISVPLLVDIGVGRSWAEME